MCKRKCKTVLALKNLQSVYSNPPKKQFFINLYDSVQLFVKIFFQFLKKQYVVVGKIDIFKHYFKMIIIIIMKLVVFIIIYLLPRFFF
jgi:hypothetical protein